MSGIAGFTEDFQCSVNSMMTVIDNQTFVISYLGLALISSPPNRVALETHDGFQFVEIQKFNIPDISVVFAAWAFLHAFLLFERKRRDYVCRAVGDN